MFSRIGCCVEYKELSVKQKEKIIQHWYNEIITKLEEDERVVIQDTDILQWFKNNAERYDNIRILKTKLENAIFEKLAEIFIISTSGG